MNMDILEFHKTLAEELEIQADEVIKQITENPGHRDNAIAITIAGLLQCQSQALKATVRTHQPRRMGTVKEALS